MTWQKTGMEIGANGEKTITYSTPKSGITIESRRRAVPHANGVGYWLHTSYFVVVPGFASKEYTKLRSAKAAAERMIQEAAQ